MTKQPVWSPSDTRLTNVAKFISYVNKRHGLQIRTYHDLHQWSVDVKSIGDFWSDAFTFLEVAPPGGSESARMLDGMTNGPLPLFPPPQYFPNSTLNLGELLLRGRDEESIAIHFAREGTSDIERVTWGELRRRVRQASMAMVKSGVRPGDVVAAVISNSVTAIVLAIATFSVGAVWSSTSCDMGVKGICDRYTQVRPRLIFADDGYVYAGKLRSLGRNIESWSNAIGEATDNLQNVVVVPYCSLNTSTSGVYKGLTYEAFVGRDSGEELNFKRFGFSQPAVILYSSGTTGTPKCIVHSTGGIALKIRTDMILQHDVRKTDVVFQFTTTSWVMWILNLVNLSCGGSMLLYDGSPFHPSSSILLQLAQDVGVTVFGTSPRYLQEIKSRGIMPRRDFNLSKLRIMTSTGATLSPELYKWFYESAFPPTAQLISMSGGTDIAGCFVGGTPLLPVYAGEIQCKALGMAVDIIDSLQTEAVSVEQLGQAGELVCVGPFPSQPLRFHGKDGMEKYKSSYFDRFGPFVWCQGDFAQRETDTGGYLMLGRSDGVLNPSGVRFGSSEIYAVIETLPDIEDSICVGQRRTIDADERVILFVKLKNDKKLSSALTERISREIRERCSPRHVPKYIFQVADIPYTVNGKKCEINVKKIVCRLNTSVSGTVANPDSLKLYEPFAHLPPEGTVDRLKPSKL